MDICYCGSVLLSSDMVSGSFYALLAGVLGAAASLSAKLSLGADYLRDMCESGISSWSQTHGGTQACDWVRPTQYEKHVT